MTTTPESHVVPIRCIGQTTAAHTPEESAQHFAEKIATVLGEDPFLRGYCRSFAAAFLSALDSPVTTVVADERPAQDNDSVGTSAAPSRQQPPTDEIRLLASACRLKSKATRWLIEQHAEMQPTITRSDLVAQAKAFACNLWMLRPTFEFPTEITLLPDLAGGYDVLAAAADLIVAITENDEQLRDFWHRAVELLAEAQSALRAAVQHVTDAADWDQRAAFWFLRYETGTRRAYIERYMRAEDKADPQLWQERLVRVAALADEVRDRAEQANKRRKIMQRLQYHVEKSLDHVEEHDLRRIVESIEELVLDGLPPSDVELRESLLPVADTLLALPGSTQVVQLVQRELRTYVLAESEESEEPQSYEPTEEFLEARRLLAGRSIVIVGGDARPHAIDALEEAFAPSPVIWIATRPHQSIATLEPAIRRPEVGLVLLAIRWSSHSFGRLKAACNKWRKHFSRLPGGYNPNQVAKHVIAQFGREHSKHAQPSDLQ